MKSSMFPRGPILARHVAEEPHILAVNCPVGGGPASLMNKQASAFWLLFTPIHRAAPRLCEVLRMNDASRSF